MSGSTFKVAAHASGELQRKSDTQTSRVKQEQKKQSINSALETRAQIETALVQRSMVERQQPAPVLKPSFMGTHEADRQMYRHQLRNEHQRAQTLNQRALTIYHKPMSRLNISDRINIRAEPRQQNLIRDDFNMTSSQEWDMQHIHRRQTDWHY